MSAPMVKDGISETGRALNYHNRIEYLISLHEEYHSEFQLKNFVIGSALTPYAKWKQVLAELRGRWRGYLSAIDEEKLLKLQIEKIARKSRFLIFSRNAKLRSEIKLNRLRSDLSILKFNNSHQKREIDILLKIANELSEKYKFDRLSYADLTELEAQIWIEKARYLAGLDIFCFKGISKETADFMFRLPVEDRKRILEDIKREPGNLLGWIDKE